MYIQFEHIFNLREMSGKDYLGYPEYVVITLPKCGTKTMNKCFTSLGYKGNKIIRSQGKRTVPFPWNAWLTSVLIILAYKIRVHKIQCLILCKQMISQKNSMIMAKKKLNLLNWPKSGKTINMKLGFHNQMFALDKYSPLNMTYFTRK